MPTKFLLPFLTSMLLLPSTLVFAQDRAEIPLWPAAAPGETGDVEPEHALPKRENENPPKLRIGNVSKPVMTLFKPENPDPKGTTVIVAPGGGYSILAYSHEGSEICEWLNSIGVTAVLLKYRVPRRSEENFHELPLMDAQRAIRMVRSKAAEWNINPDRIGMLGFSAGGHLTVMAGTNGGKASYEAVDEIDQLSPQLNFMIPIYPAYLLNKKTNQLNTNIVVNKDIPPAFIAITFDDSERAVGAAMLLVAMKKVDVPCELHVYRNGGHGYGMRASKNAVSKWPELCRDWFAASGLIE
ncbi:Acetylxylan esterase precursor [Roseimaritima multifibrata]|uniref:Acetylxylan esterase n=1 Tax=Roseimaritima multifibrata TaxID=1930274 RepID=A0A517M9C2_9BACT|nr:alpha/beta hydrolase [Roseimaritima multifibrata]QDS91387.1 Acetylxylan esterase precursor [Roseimaritima multifibrata]